MDGGIKETSAFVWWSQKGAELKMTRLLFVLTEMTRYRRKTIESEHRSSSARNRHTQRAGIQEHTIGGTSVSCKKECVKSFHHLDMPHGLILQ